MAAQYAVRMVMMRVFGWTPSEKVHVKRAVKMSPAERARLFEENRPKLAAYAKIRAKAINWIMEQYPMPPVGGIGGIAVGMNVPKINPNGLVYYPSRWIAAITGVGSSDAKRAAKSSNRNVYIDIFGTVNDTDLSPTDLYNKLELERMSVNSAKRSIKTGVKDTLAIAYSGKAPLTKAGKTKAKPQIGYLSAINSSARKMGLGGLCKMSKQTQNLSAYLKTIENRPRGAVYKRRYHKDVESLEDRGGNCYRKPPQYHRAKKDSLPVAPKADWA